METIADNSKAFWDAFQDENARWATANFPGAIGHPEQPMVGIFEELGELAEAIELKDRDKAVDATADVAIYAIDFCNKLSISAAEVFAEAAASAAADDVDEEQESSVFSRLMALVGRLSHHWLKKEQRIRRNEDHDLGARKALVGILAIAWDVHDEVRHEPTCTYPETIWGVWQRIVSKRDWAKYPGNGGPR
jgi:NTP pyrophosphatase (non-canonical NTP hydrolase)